MDNEIWVETLPALAELIKSWALREYPCVLVKIFSHNDVLVYERPGKEGPGGGGPIIAARVVGDIASDIQIPPGYQGAKKALRRFYLTQDMKDLLRRINAYCDSDDGNGGEEAGGDSREVFAVSLAPRCTFPNIPSRFDYVCELSKDGADLCLVNKDWGEQQMRAAIRDFLENRLADEIKAGRVVVLC